jgi:hypothetical protein
METNDDQQQKYARENEILHNQVKGMQEEIRELQHDYQSLRLQKGGFGFKMLLAFAFAGMFAGVAVCYLFFRPKDDHVQAFERFRREHQYNIEFSIGQGKFADAEADLKDSAEKPENAIIKPEIDWTRKIVGAAKRRCGQ